MTRIVYRLTTPGDRWVGIWGDEAEVVFYGEWEPVEECDATRRAALVEVFGDLLDGKVTVTRDDDPLAETR